MVGHLGEFKTKAVRTLYSQVGMVGDKKKDDGPAVPVAILLLGSSSTTVAHDMLLSKKDYAAAN